MALGTALPCWIPATLHSVFIPVGETEEGEADAVGNDLSSMQLLVELFVSDRVSRIADLLTLAPGQFQLKMNISCQNKLSTLLTHANEQTPSPLSDQNVTNILMMSWSCFYVNKFCKAEKCSTNFKEVMQMHIALSNNVKKNRASKCNKTSTKAYNLIM